METTVKVNGNVVPFEANGKLALGAFFAMLFLPSSASASVPGENRGIAAKIIGKNLDAIGEIETLSIETDDEIVNINCENLAGTLEAIESAYAKNEAFRQSVLTENASYKSVRSVTVKNPKDTAKRGRKSQDVTERYESALLAGL